MTSRARRVVHLCVVQPVGYVHSMGLLDAALYFQYQFRRLGAEVTIAKNRLRHDAPNLIFGAHLGFDPAIQKTFCCVFVNLEQLGSGGSRMPPAYLELLRTSHVIDYDAANVGAFTRNAADVPLISFGYAPYLAATEETAPLDQRPFDLLFFGSMNPRRQQIIERIERTGRTVVLFDAPVYGPERDAFIVRSRAVLNCHHYDSAVFEQVRAFQVLSLGTPLVSELTDRTHPGSAYEATVNWFNDESLERFFTTEYPSGAFSLRAEAQLLEFRSADPKESYTRTLDFALAAYATAKSIAQAPTCPQNRLHIGSGKDYRTGWLNVDVQANAQPDIVADLSLPHTWPANYPSAFWGTVQLNAGGTDLIYANNVLEHISDLATFMSNCLALLRDGGQMVIEVPYEKSLGAWQDPTHVRAMNENSWLYYTDWFWYLGWFEHRFILRDLKWLDGQLVPCNKATAEFMTVTLEKRATTVAERMTARTMQPDFGGLLDAVQDQGPAPVTIERESAGGQDTAPPPAVATSGAPRSSEAASPHYLRSAAPRAVELPQVAAPVVPQSATNYYDGLNVKLLAAIPACARRVLELGCANGLLGRRYKELNPASQWWGVDISATATATAAAHLDRVVTLDLDSGDLTALDEGFDVIVIGDLLEHLRDPARVLDCIHQRSAPGAKIVCCLPNMSHASVIERLVAGDIGYDDAGLLDRTHMRFFSQASAFKTFLDAGWLPNLQDQYRVEPAGNRFTAGLLDAAAALGIPRETAQRNLGMYQMIVVCEKWRERPACAATDAVPFSVIVPVNRPWQFALNIARSPGLREVQAEVISVEGAPNAAAAYAAGCARARHAWRLFVHQDVYFPIGTGHAIAQQLGALERVGAQGKPVGMAGLQPGEGNRGVRYAGMVIDRTTYFSHGPSSNAVSMDELAVALHRDSRLEIDPELGWHLWATDLCLQAQRLTGQSVAQILTVPLFHNSVCTWTLPDALRESVDALLAKYPELAEIPTLCGTLSRSSTQLASA